MPQWCSRSPAGYCHSGPRKVFDREFGQQKLLVPLCVAVGLAGTLCDTCIFDVYISFIICNTLKLSISLHKYIRT